MADYELPIAVAEQFAPRFASDAQAKVQRRVLRAANLEEGTPTQLLNQGWSQIIQAMSGPADDVQTEVVGRILEGHLLDSGVASEPIGDKAFVHGLLGGLDIKGIISVLRTFSEADLDLVRRFLRMTQARFAVFAASSDPNARRLAAGAPRIDTGPGLLFAVGYQCALLPLVRNQIEEFVHDAQGEILPE